VWSNIVQQQPLTPAAREAARLRSGLARLRSGEMLCMVCVPCERDAIWAELTPRERSRVKLLTSWPWDQPALASARLAAAA
jgi:hypothetical protein